MPRNLGGKERPKDERDFLLGSIQAPVSIPNSFIPDITWLKRNYQGETDYCGAHGGSHFQAIMEHVFAPTISQRYTPRYLWIDIKQIDGYPLEDGTDMRSIFKTLQNKGIANYEPLENDVTLPIATYSDKSVITPAMDADAANQKITSYAFGNTDFNSLCQHIYQNKAVLLLIKCDGGFWQTTTPTFTQPLYGHFIVAYGYDTEYIYAVDSADPSDINAFKEIAKQYITPTFIIESGTALDIPPALVQQSVSVAQAIVASPDLTPQAKLFDLTVILNFLKSLFSSKVVGSASPDTMNYSLFKSRTFWTLVATFVYNVWQLAAPSVPPQYSAIVDFVLTSAAAYFHLQTGQSTTGTN